MPEDIEGRIVDYIGKEILFEDRPTLGVDDPLLGGTLDSVGIMQLVSFVEEEFGIEIPDQSVTAANFRSTRAVAALVQQELRAASERSQ